jgi:hypothetical protein
MPKYLTVQSYINCDDYPLTAAETTLILSRTIQRAEGDIDAALGFDLRLGGFEPHTAWVQSQWDAKTLRTRVPLSPVPVRRAVRYQIQVSNLSGSGAGFMATINSNDVAYNTFDDYVEIVPLQSITYSLTPVLVQLGLRPPIVQMDLEFGYFLGVTGETLIDSGDQKTYYAARGFWASSYTQAASIQPNTLPAIPPVVYANGTVVSSGLYMTNPTEGTVTFTTARPVTDSISLDYTYTIPDNVRDACIHQTTYLLGQRALNKLGIQGLEWVRSGDQQVRRHANSGLVPNSPLCELAAFKLANYLPIPMA